MPNPTLRHDPPRSRDRAPSDAEPHDTPHREWALEIAVVGVLTVLAVGLEMRVCWGSLLTIAGAVTLGGVFVGGLVSGLLDRGPVSPSVLGVFGLGIAGIITGVLFVVGMGIEASFGVTAELVGIATLVQLVWAALPVMVDRLQALRASR